MILICFIDGADFHFAKEHFWEHPAFARARKDGSWGIMEAVEPTNTGANWATIHTGLGPDHHGILDLWTERLVPEEIKFAGEWPRCFPFSSFDILKHRPIWPELVGGGIRGAIINCPLTWPAPQIGDLAVVSGFGAIDNSQDISWPPSLDLMNYPTEFFSEIYITPGNDGLDQVWRAGDKLTKWIEPRLGDFNWMLINLVLPDRAVHWDSARYEPAFQEALNRTWRLAQKADTVIIGSDHGMDVEEGHPHHPDGLFLSWGKWIAYSDKEVRVPIGGILPTAGVLLGRNIDKGRDYEPWWEILEAYKPDERAQVIARLKSLGYVD